MSHTRSSLTAAEREASNRTVDAQRAGLPWRYRAQRYPNGTHDIASWPWGVMQLQTDYYPPDWSDRTRQVGFVWEPN